MHLESRDTIGHLGGVGGVEERGEGWGEMQHKQTCLWSEWEIMFWISLASSDSNHRENKNISGKLSSFFLRVLELHIKRDNMGCLWEIVAGDKDNSNTWNANNNVSIVNP